MGWARPCSSAIRRLNNFIEAIDRPKEKTKAFKLVDREAGKEVALGTSKITSTLGKSSDRVVRVGVLACSDSSHLLRTTAA